MKVKELIPPVIMENYHKKAMRKFYSNQCLQYMRMNGIIDSPVDGEQEYLKMWSVFKTKVEKQSYRYYSHYCGKTPYIVPENILHDYIEPKLNPVRYLGYYSDKNIFEKLLPSEYVIPTVLRRMGGGILDGSYKPVTDLRDILLRQEGDLFLKPSVDTSSGIGVQKYVKHDNEYVEVRSQEPLSIEKLKSYGLNFILQNAVMQHPYVSQLCSSSINTLRIATYRSVIDEKPHVIGALIRIGKEGEYVDNAHAGGRFVAINKETGELGKCAVDQYGRIYNEWNDINFLNSNFVYPHWDKVLQCALEVTQSLHHMRLIQLDIAMDINNCPKIIEYNVIGYSPWLYMTTGCIPLGEYTSEIIDYCCR